jgi:hypothetical protein
MLYIKSHPPSKNATPFDILTCKDCKDQWDHRGSVIDRISLRDYGVCSFCKEDQDNEAKQTYLTPYGF